MGQKAEEITNLTAIVKKMREEGLVTIEFSHSIQFANKSARVINTTDLAQSINNNTLDVSMLWQ